MILSRTKDQQKPILPTILCLHNVIINKKKPISWNWIKSLNKKDFTLEINLAGQVISSLVGDSFEVQGYPIWGSGSNSSRVLRQILIRPGLSLKQEQTHHLTSSTSPKKRCTGMGWLLSSSERPLLCSRSIGLRGRSASSEVAPSKLPQLLSSSLNT